MLVALAVERTPEVMEHAERVLRYSMSMAGELRVAPALRPSVELGARFHDIGKVATPEPILTKPSPLTPSEVAIMRRHVDAGAEILEGTVALAENRADRPCVARVVRRRRVPGEACRRGRFRWPAGSSPLPTPTMG